MSFLVILLATYTMVNERTREIGILRALGAGNVYIMGVVLIESSLICIAGVLFGFGLSVVGRWCLLTLFPTLAVSLLPRWFAIAASLGLGGGLLGAVYPAIRAAGMDPVKALSFNQ